MGVSRSRPPLLPPLLPLEFALEPAITRVEILTRASLAHSAATIDSSMAVRHTQAVCRGHLVWYRNMLVYLLLAFLITRHRLLRARAQGLLPRLLTVLTAVPATGTSA